MGAVSNSRLRTETSPLVSVCVQTYQHSNYIRECLDGVLSQITDFPYEIVLGEDESTDGTREICMEYAKNNPETVRLFLRSRAEVIFIDNHATGRYNLIENLKAARGTYVALCEGDDYWTDPYKLQKQVDFLRSNDGLSACFHRVNSLPSDGVRELNQAMGKLNFSIRDLFGPWFIATSSIMFKASTNLTIPEWFSNVVNGDLALLMLLAKNGDIGLIDEKMGVYRIHGEGLSRKTNTPSLILNIAYIYKSMSVESGNKFDTEASEGLDYLIKERYRHYFESLLVSSSPKTMSETIPMSRLIQAVALKAERYFRKLSERVMWKQKG